MDASLLQALLRNRPLVADGGIGWLLYQTLSYPRALCIKHTPLTHAETVLQIHRIGEYPEAKGVYEVDAIGLVKILSNFNRGVDWAGKSLGTPTDLTIGVAVNPTAEDMDREIERFQAKLDAGAHVVMLQPIFEVSQWEAFLTRWGRPLPIPFMFGLWPRASYDLA